MSDDEAVVANNDFLDEQSDDALAFQYIQAWRLCVQTLEEFAQRVSEPQVRGLIRELGTQRVQFRLQPCLALAQFGHAPSELFQAEQIFLVGGQQPLNAPLGLEQFAGGLVLVLLGWMGSACRLYAPCQFGLNQRRILQQSGDLGPYGLLQQIEPDGLRVP